MVLRVMGEIIHADKTIVDVTIVMIETIVCEMIVAIVVGIIVTIVDARIVLLIDRQVRNPTDNDHQTNFVSIHQQRTQGSYLAQPRCEGVGV